MRDFLYLLIGIGILWLLLSGSGESITIEMPSQTSVWQSAPAWQSRWDPSNDGPAAVRSSPFGPTRLPWSDEVGPAGGGGSGGGSGGFGP